MGHTQAWAVDSVVLFHLLWPLRTHAATDDFTKVRRVAGFDSNRFPRRCIEETPKIVVSRRASHWMKTRCQSVGGRRWTSGTMASVPGLLIRPTSQLWILVPLNWAH